MPDLIMLNISATSHTRIDGVKPVLTPWATRHFASTVATYNLTGTFSTLGFFEHACSQRMNAQGLKGFPFR
jgi:hypothetical protein